MRTKSSITLSKKEESEILELLKDVSNRESGIVIEISNLPIYERFPQGRVIRTGVKHLPTIYGEYYYRNFVKYNDTWLLTIFNSHEKSFSVYGIEQEAVELCEKYLSHKNELLALLKTEEQSRDKNVRIIALKYGPEKIAEQLSEIRTPGDYL